MTAEQPDDIYQFTIDLGKRAGYKSIDGIYSPPMSGNDVVNGIDANTSSNLAFTEKDNAVDASTVIATKCPSHEFIGEVTYAKSSARDYLRSLKQPVHPTWCVDPLDGTVNYIHLFPKFCVSIAILVKGRSVIGSCIGRGAWYNEKIPPTLTQKPSIPPTPTNAPSKKMDSFANMAPDRGGCCRRNCVLLETGGLGTTVNPPNDRETAPIEEVRLVGPPVIEIGRPFQERAVRDIWKCVKTPQIFRPSP
ncbi:inositol monophosphatase family-domain-containing protein [Talaromyces proteolyticus]|uniref:Inositol monophosphatase family-domain-containing protein n=1 Tax=Talaromyces proteolyticus TaxID=1131652 RepID=A0AAD4KSX8_9EURO|nr:inositol monophosphatase family-domain-containing protein [Talaromyces proteolyticus]KAH8698603.1 inositol monophosphatase family-domain-containing protein [Talaromyces proteolyticus]